MGMNVNTYQLSPKLVKSEENVRAYFKSAVEVARIQYGEDCYSGEWNTLHRLTFTGQKFELFDDADEYLSDKVQKGDALVAQVKTFEQGKRLTAAIQKQRETAEAAHQARRQGKTDRQIKAAGAAYQRAVEKVKEIRTTMAAKSTKYAWVICAGCAE